MPKVETLQTNFTAGELSPSMVAREDITRYFNGARSIENFFIRPQGPAQRRSGTEFMAEVKDSTRKTKLVRFTFSREQNYILEFGHQYIRFYQNKTQIAVSGVPVEVATPFTESQLEDLDFARSADILYISHREVPVAKLTRLSNTDWTFTYLEAQDGPYLPVDSSQISLRVDPDTVEGEVLLDLITSEESAINWASTPYIEYQEDGVWKIAKYVSDAASPVSGYTRVTCEAFGNILAELDATAKMIGFPSVGASGSLTSDKAIFNRGNLDHYLRFRLSEVSTNEAAGWALSTRYDSQTALQGTRLAFTSTSTPPVVISTTITATLEIGGASPDDILDSTDVGRQFRLQYDTQQVPGEVTAYNSTGNLSVTLTRFLPRDPSNGDTYIGLGCTRTWRLGAWSERTGYPSAISFYEERFLAASSLKEPQTLWFSVSADFENFSPTEPDSLVGDSNGITISLGSSESNRIVWLSPKRALLAGTIGEEWQISAPNSEVLTPSNRAARPVASFGSKEGVRPIRIGDSTLFVQRSGRKLRELAYQSELDPAIQEDVTIYSEHILREGGDIVALAYQQEPYSAVWVVRADGEVAVLTYIKDQQVAAWVRFKTTGKVKDVETIPSTDGTYDEVYFIVERTIENTPRQYVEVLSEDFHEGEIAGDDMLFVDSSLSYSGAPTTTLSNLDHLELQTVSVFADGSALPDAQVINGQITLDRSVSKAVVGLGYRSLIYTMPIVSTTETGGSSSGNLRRVKQTAVRLLETRGLKLGSTLENLRELSFRAARDVMDRPPDLFTGVRAEPITQNPSYDGGIYIVQDAPYPATVLGLSHDVELLG